MVNDKTLLSDEEIDNPSQYQQQPASDKQDSGSKSDISSEYATRARELIDNLKTSQFTGAGSIPDVNQRSIDTLIEKIETLDKKEAKGFFGQLVNSLEKGLAALTGQDYFDTRTGKELSRTKTELSSYISHAEQKVGETEGFIAEYEDTHSSYTVEINSALNQYKQHEHTVKDKEELLKAMEHEIANDPADDTLEVSMEIENMRRDLEIERDNLYNLEEHLDSLRYERDSCTSELQDLRVAKRMLEYSSRLASLTVKRIETYLAQEKTRSPYVTLGIGKQLDHSAYESQKLQIDIDSKRKQYFNQITEKIPKGSDRRKHLRDLQKNSPKVKR
ncbi:MAG: hypothetical protein ACLFTH_01030 [Candidatus Woesearchaeota archaeon]